MDAHTTVAVNRLSDRDCRQDRPEPSKATPVVSQVFVLVHGAWHEALKRLIYLDAVLLENGQSAFGKLDPSVVTQRVKLAQESSEGLTIPPPSPGAFGVTETHDTAWLRRRLTPHPLNSYQEPIRLNHPLGNGVKKIYIACTDPACP
jgi:hypothetical protein